MRRGRASPSLSKLPPEEIKLKYVFAFLLAAVLAALVAGCNESVPSNEEELAKIKDQPTNNPDVPAVDAKNEMPIGKRRN